MKYKLPKKTVKLWQIRTALVCIGLLLICCISLLISIYFLILITLLAVIFTAFTVIYVPIHLKSYEITLTRESVIINRGFIIRAQHIMPYRRLIYAESITTPCARRMGLTAAALKAARGFIIIPEMEMDDAKRLLNAISGEKR